MKKLFIVGGDGFAREMLVHIRLHPSFGSEFDFGGYLGHGGYGHTVDYKDGQCHYKGELLDYAFGENDYCIIGAGDTALRKIIFQDLKNGGVKMHNFISSGCVIGDSVTLGEGNVILYSTLTANISMGNGNLLNCNVAIGHDCDVGDFNFFGPRSLALGWVKIGNGNSLGAGSIVLPKAKLGDNNKIAPLSAIYKGCKNNGYYLGNPAVKMGSID
jgi:acetyltransferase-like isoleucine patch superfamily enzyme